MTIRERVARRKRPGWMMPWLMPLFVVELVLVLFYLPQFRATGEVCGCFDRGTDVPIAHEVNELAVAPVVEIKHKMIRLDGRPMNDRPEGRVQIGSMVPKLRDELVTIRNVFMLLHPQDDGLSGTYALVAAPDTPFWLIARVMRTAASSGFDVPQYVVRN